MAAPSGFRDHERLYVGLDVGSTTVKAVVVDPATDEILWQDYQRHDTKQPEKVPRVPDADRGRLPGSPAERFRIFITGSGGSGVGAAHRREVRPGGERRVAWPSRSSTPTCGSVIELGGQDAKIIVFKDDPETGEKKKIPSMNDKCAGGTGAVIDKIIAKLQIPAGRALPSMGYDGHQAPPRRRQVRRLRRDRHQRPAEAWASRPTS